MRSFYSDVGLSLAGTIISAGLFFGSGVDALCLFAVATLLLSLAKFNSQADHNLTTLFGGQMVFVIWLFALLIHDSFDGEHSPFFPWILAAMLIVANIVGHYLVFRKRVKAQIVA